LGNRSVFIGPCLHRKESFFERGRILRFSRISSILALSAVLLLAAPAFADSYTVFTSVTGDYASATNYGGGDGSYGSITTLGSFLFFNALQEAASTTGNVLSDTNDGLTIGLTSSANIAGFYYQAVKTIGDMYASFYNSEGSLIDTIKLDSDDTGDIELIALEDTTAGESISTIEVYSDDDYTPGHDYQFLLSDLSAGEVSGTAATPEPGTLALFGSGLLGLAGMIRRRRSA
jgi:hypothetical protein